MKVRARCGRGLWEFIELNPKTDPIFLDSDNPIFPEGVRRYEHMIDAGKPLEPIGVACVLAKELAELGISLTPLSGTKKPRGWIFIVANGHHRSIAARNKGILLQASVVAIR